MGTLQDALKQAVVAQPGLAAREPAPPVGVALLPAPAASEWAVQLRALGVSVQSDSSPAQLVQKTAAILKDLARQGRSREAKSLAKLRDEFVRDREKRCWELVKARFSEMAFPEKTYRALKQEGADPERVLTRLHTRRAEEWRGIAGAKLRDHLLDK